MPDDEQAVPDAVNPPADMIELGFVYHLLNDVSECVPHWNGEKAQFWRRTAYRALFGFLEAWVSTTRDHLPHAIRENLVGIVTTPEVGEVIRGLLAATNPISYELKESGLFYRKNRKLRFLFQLQGGRPPQPAGAGQEGRRGGCLLPAGGVEVDGAGGEGSRSAHPPTPP